MKGVEDVEDGPVIDRKGSAGELPPWLCFGGPDQNESVITQLCSASVAARGGNLKGASLVVANPAPSDEIPRIDTMTDILTNVQIRTGHELFGKVVAGSALRFSQSIGSVDKFRELSSSVLCFATKADYRAENGWIDYAVPEDDESVIETVLDCVWRGADPNGLPVNVEVAWWEEVREPASDRPVKHWRLFGERREANPCQTVTLTWPAVRARIRHLSGIQCPGSQALGTEIRFFSDDDDELGRCPVAELLSAELVVEGRTYVMVDGLVCRVDSFYLAALDTELESHLSARRLLAYQPAELEAEYNRRVARATGMLLLDTCDIRPRGQTQIEPCDLLGLDGCLYHIKRKTCATGISHLANQALSSATMLLREQGSRDKLNDLIARSGWAPDDRRRVCAQLGDMAGPGQRFPVALAIIGEWEDPTIKSLSLLARLALRRAIRNLQDLSFPTELMLIDCRGG